MPVRLSALREGHTLTPEIYSGTHSCYRLNEPQGHGAAGRIRYTEEFQWPDRDLTASSIAP
jgi:hypothetical protein